ncbi:hypothetical protein R3P38DRAFT_3281536 [Favolaschia claudopus]|uniref:Uncharacterized protein n=1 Tax=Favolaschia claudopus TaxID=2862362 RepID=A0AAW0AFC5_9AGAR
MHSPYLIDASNKSAKASQLVDWTSKLGEKLLRRAPFAPFLPCQLPRPHNSLHGRCVNRILAKPSFSRPLSWRHFEINFDLLSSKPKRLKTWSEAPDVSGHTARDGSTAGETFSHACGQCQDESSCLRVLARIVSAAMESSEPGLPATSEYFFKRGSLLQHTQHTLNIPKIRLCPHPNETTKASQVARPDIKSKPGEELLDAHFPHCGDHAAFSALSTIQTFQLSISQTTPLCCCRLELRNRNRYFQILSHLLPSLMWS